LKESDLVFIIYQQHLFIRVVQLLK
jgi:hypothetical protein